MSTVYFFCNFTLRDRWLGEGGGGVVSSCTIRSYGICEGHEDSMSIINLIRQRGKLTRQMPK